MNPPAEIEKFNIIEKRPFCLLQQNGLSLSNGRKKNPAALLAATFYCMTLSPEIASKCSHSESISLEDMYIFSA